MLQVVGSQLGNVVYVGVFVFVRIYAAVLVEIFGTAGRLLRDQVFVAFFFFLSCFRLFYAPTARSQCRGTLCDSRNVLI